jgi:hypothetical protein
MKVVYIAGVHKFEYLHETMGCIKKAEAIADKYWKMGYGVILPHRNSSRDHLFFDGLLPDDYIFDGYIEILSRCDIVVMMKGWEQSEWARREESMARDLVDSGMEIIYDDGEVIEKIS